MNRYRVTVTVTETRIAEEDITFDVDAEDEEAAKKEARDLAPPKISFSAYDFDHDDTSTYVQSVEFIKGDDPPDVSGIPRCEKTIDMFSGVDQ